MTTIQDGSPAGRAGASTLGEGDVGRENRLGATSSGRAQRSPAHGAHAGADR